MDLVLQRLEADETCTIGELSINGTFECWTLEDVVRADGIKIAGETAIPAGTYTIEISQSPRFGRLMPLLVNVNGFVGIRIHWGNDPGDTDGCILVGRQRAHRRILESRAAFDILFAKLQEASNRAERIEISVLNVTT